METGILLQSFAMDKDKRMRSVDEVARGLSCECICPCCGENVIARQGEVREWHFSHASGADCEHAAEGALHLAAKQVLLESGGINLPEVRLEVSVCLPDGRVGKGEAYRPEMWVDFDSIEAEQTVATIRPDIVAVTGNKMLFIEIAVTHFIDDCKKKVLDELMVPTIEIDLGGMARAKWDWELLHDVLVKAVTHKAWIHFLDQNALELEARNAALQSALTCPLQVQEKAISTPRRTRFWIGARMVDVIERPFGLAVWSPYDPGLNELIKSLMRLLGGRWQPRFKNWLTPLDAKEYLFRELGKLSSRPPKQM